MNKIIKFAELLEDETKQRLKEKGLDCEVNIMNAKVTVVPGKKYTKVDIGRSGRFMIDGEDIYGIKAYGVIHRGHYYGNLDTINEYFWGNYFPVKKQAVDMAA